MKHNLLIGLTLFTTALASVPANLNAASSASYNQENGTLRGVESSGSENGIIGGADMDKIIDILSQVQAYVFLARGDERDLTQTFNRTGQINFETEDLRDLDWTVGNESIATISKNDGKIRGLNYGETIIKVHDPADGKDSYFVVFVCPTITVKSPEGAVYKYQKMYNHRAKIQLTHGKNYFINSVMCNGEDITEFVDKDENGDGDGYYLSDKPITGDMTFVITEEKIPEDFNKEDDSVVISSDIKVLVKGQEIILVDLSENEKNDLRYRGVHLIGPSGVYHYIDILKPSDTVERGYSVISPTKGIFTVKLNYMDSREFKVIVE